MLPFGSFFEELDFDDEPPARERRGPRFGRKDDGGDRPPTGGGGGGGGFFDDENEEPPGRARPQWSRIAILVGAVVVLALAGYWYVQRCQRSQEVDSYKSYVRDANALTVRGNKAAEKLQAALLKQSQTPTGLTAAFAATAKEQEAVAAGAAKLHGPGGFARLQPAYLEAQQLRANGFTQMAKSLGAAFAAYDKKTQSIPVDKVANVSLLYHRVLAGDVVYADAFLAPGTKVLENKDITKVSIEPSAYVTQPLLAFTLPDRLAERLATIYSNNLPGGSGGDTPGKVHGTRIEAVSIKGKALDPNAPTTVTLQDTGENTIDVTAKNGGDFQETSVSVTVVVDGKQLDPQSIQVFDPQTTQTLRFPFSPIFERGVQHVIKVVIAAVPGEKNTTNNFAKYTVLFTLGG
jgi:hypothetical protein